MRTRPKETWLVRPVRGDRRATLESQDGPWQARTAHLEIAAEQTGKAECCCTETCFEHFELSSSGHATL
jgi:hypothetical protein